MQQNSRNNQCTISENNYDYKDFNFIVNKNRGSLKDQVVGPVGPEQSSHSKSVPRYPHANQVMGSPSHSKLI